ncbi:grb10-interacting gyf protein [Anaeramoeba flamelloides]|uniref:Grb10-interacting gyf protein n=1 Tax=Anaeramoeba flamelloides TaxID=1746091 RepID=A0AAV7ZBF3_9EUKA|nr:grb10-interacting gyf protein [Anaeramoeba flamelloides]KAJ6248995.1 grb10-interacting gyf protein [Anaeramoeba flamelloides]
MSNENKKEFEKKKVKRYSTKEVLSVFNYSVPLPETFKQIKNIFSERTLPPVLQIPFTQSKSGVVTSSVRLKLQKKKSKFKNSYYQKNKSFNKQNYGNNEDKNQQNSSNFNRYKKNKEHTWFYLDDEHVKQGTFDQSKMEDWFKKDFFNPMRMVSRSGDIFMTPLGLSFEDFKNSFSSGNKCTIPTIQTQIAINKFLETNRNEITKRIKSIIEDTEEDSYDSEEDSSNSQEDRSSEQSSEEN